MARVTYQYPVADVCGKIGKDAPVGFAHRGNTKFTVKYGKRSTTVTQDEKDRQKRFAAAVKQTRERMLDPDQSLMDQIAFSKQTQYKTLYQYVFNQVYQTV